ncbi:MAG: hypothetical protein JJ964_14520 [Rhizobiales bacterium]|nr:hypothetical protein [Hyphomicrobiales bacterium]
MKQSLFFSILCSAAISLTAPAAHAADLGGDCCADLEERVATLEATTARKGNRKVSLSISGWVNQALYIWDDGVDSDVYQITDNGNTLSTRITFAGSARINTDWSAGYTITIEPIQAEGLFGVSQQNDDGSFVNGLGLLESYMYVKNERLGTLSWGLQQQASDNVGVVDLSGGLWSGVAPIFRGNRFKLRSANGGSFNADGSLAAGLNGANVPGSNPLKTGITSADFAACNAINAGIGMDCFGLLTNSVKYVSPTVSGFTLSTSWGENDFFEVAGAVGYINATSNSNGGNGIAAAGTDVEVFNVAGGFMHVPTGIFANFDYNTEKVDSIGGISANALVNAFDPNARFEDNPESFYLKVGIKQKWNSLGATSIFGDYGIYKDRYEPLLFNNGVTGSEITRWGVGVNQWVDAAAMQLYVKYTHLEFEVDAVAGSTAAPLSDGIRDWDEVVVGGIIFF